MTYRDRKSERGTVECGVAQGSVLGPLFFLISVNDMIKACEGLELVLFGADDTNIYAEKNDRTELFGKVNRGLGELSGWFRCSRLKLNHKKTDTFCRTRGAWGATRGYKDRH